MSERDDEKRPASAASRMKKKAPELDKRFFDIKTVVLDESEGFIEVPEPEETALEPAPLTGSAPQTEQAAEAQSEQAPAEKMSVPESVQPAEAYKEPEKPAEPVKAAAPEPEYIPVVTAPVAIPEIKPEKSPEPIKIAAPAPEKVAVEKARDSVTEKGPEPFSEPLKQEPEKVAERPAESAEPKRTERVRDKRPAHLKSEDEEEFDYVVPETTFYESERQRRQRHRHHHHHHHSSGSKSGSSGKTRKAAADEETDFVFLKPRKKKKKHHHHSRPKKTRRRPRMKRWKKVLLICISVLLVLIIGLVGTFFIIREIGRRGMHNYDSLQIVTPTQDESGNEVVAVDKTGRVINYDGVSYAFNDDVLALTMIGVDDGNASEEGLRMADAIYILTIDTSSGAVRVLGISRDTMTDVDIYSGEGKYIDTENRQITYSYAYSGEGVTGGANTNKSISRLFYGLPLGNYFAFDLDALKTINDSIGGVTLTSSMTFVSPEDGRTISEGETVTLHGEEAERYIRARDTEVLESNNDRMQRQQEYIKAFVSSAIPAAKKDLSVVTNLYSAVSDNSESSLDLPKVTYLATTALSFLKNASDIEYINLKGEITAGEHAELRPKNEDILKTMLKVFYKPIATIPTIAPSTQPLSTVPQGTAPDSADQQSAQPKTAVPKSTGPVG